MEYLNWYENEKNKKKKKKCKNRNSKEKTPKMKVSKKRYFVMVVNEKIKRRFNPYMVIK